MGRIGGARRWLAGWLWRADLIVLIAAGLTAGGVWAFLVIADVVSAGGYGQTDARILRALRETDDVGKPVGPRWLEEAGRDVTALGGQGACNVFCVR